jgi:hypothetical protein
LLQKLFLAFDANASQLDRIDGQLVQPYARLCQRGAISGLER